MNKASIQFINLALISLASGLIGACESGIDSSESASLSQEKLIFGSDDRKEIGQLTDPRQISWANGTAVFFDKDDVVCSGASCNLRTKPYGDSQGGVYIPVCSGEPFLGQPQGGHCTGFLIAPDLLVTAGHCTCIINQTNLVFGFQVDALGRAATTVPEQNVYHCREIVAQAVTYNSSDGLSDVDFAVLRLDRPVANRAPLPIRKTGTVPDYASLAVVGSPVGLPLKYAPGASLKINVPTNLKFAMNLDASPGTSGAPVINVATGLVEGIVSTGPMAEDYVTTDVDGTTCTRTNHCDDDTGCPTAGQWVKASRLVNVVEVLEGRSCYDRRTNGQETDVDCGGPSCDGCAMGKTCQRDSDCYQYPNDCRTAVCNQSHQCVESYGSCELSCNDGTANGFETDVDCGGPCTSCGIGRQCMLARDCASRACSLGLCATEPALGDADGEGGISKADADFVAKASVGLVTLPFPKAADVNCDGRASIVDALLIAQFTDRIITTFPCQ